VEGEFSRGDAIGIASADGVLIARGLSNYSSADMSRILGKKTQQIRQILAEAAYDEAIHRDNLVLERPNHP
jgi:glutamate 5-kinase